MAAKASKSLRSSLTQLQAEICRTILPKRNGFIEKMEIMKSEGHLKTNTEKKSHCKMRAAS